jgi:hypothetical protein
MKTVAIEELSLEECPLVCPQFDPLFYCFVPYCVWFRPIRTKCLAAPRENETTAMSLWSSSPSLSLSLPCPQSQRRTTALIVTVLEFSLIVDKEEEEEEEEEET